MNLQEIKKVLTDEYFNKLELLNANTNYNELTKELNLSAELTNKIDRHDERCFINITKSTRDTLNLQLGIFSSSISYYNHQDELDELIKLYDNVNVDSYKVCELFAEEYLIKILSDLNTELHDLGINKVIVNINHKYPFCKRRNTFYTAYDVETNDLNEHYILLGDFKRIFYEDFARLLLKYNKDLRYKELTNALNFTTRYNNQPYTLTSDISIKDYNYFVVIKKLKSNKLEIGIRFNNYPEQFVDNNKLIARFKSNDYKKIEKKKLVDCNKVAEIFLTEYLLPYLKTFSKILLNNGITQVSLISEFGYPYYGKGVFEQDNIKIS